MRGSEPWERAGGACSQAGRGAGAGDGCRRDRYSGTSKERCDPPVHGVVPAVPAFSARFPTRCGHSVDPGAVRTMPPGSRGATGHRRCPPRCSIVESVNAPTAAHFDLAFSQFSLVRKRTDSTNIGSTILRATPHSHVHPSAPGSTATAANPSTIDASIQ